MFLNGIKRIESNQIQFIFVPNETTSKKFIDNNRHSQLIYIDEFEIIDKDFYSYLKKLYKNNIPYDLNSSIFQIFQKYGLLLK